MRSINLQKYVFIVSILFLSSFFCLAQANKITKPISKPDTQAVKSSPAFAEILLRKVEIQSELEEFLIEYTEEFPKVKELRFQLELLNKGLERLLSVKPEEASKLTLALGKLMVRKTDFETDLWSLGEKYNDQHPDVKRAKRKVEVFESAIREILP